MPDLRVSFRDAKNRSVKFAPQDARSRSDRPRPTSSLLDQYPIIDGVVGGAQCP